MTPKSLILQHQFGERSEPATGRPRKSRRRRRITSAKINVNGTFWTIFKQHGNHLFDIKTLIYLFFLQCNNCNNLVIHPDQRFSFFSDYSQIVSCPHCGVQEAHFAKNLPSIFMRRDERSMRVTRVNSA